MSTWPLKMFNFKFPKWATGVGRLKEPTEGEKSNGWSLAECAPARLMNWLQHMTFQWLLKFAGLAVGNWACIDESPTPAANIISGAYSDLVGRWVFITYQSGPTTVALRSPNGRDFQSTTISETSLVTQDSHILAVNADGYNVATRDGRVHYSSDGFTGWATYDDGIHDLGYDNIRILRSKGTDSSFLVAVVFASSNSYIIYSTTGATGTWTLSSTSFTTINIRDIIYGGGTTWYAVDINGNCYCSIDDCVTWSTRGSFDLLVGEYLYNPKALAYDPDLGQLVVVGGFMEGEADPNLFAAYSLDGGYNWALSVFNLDHTLSELNDVIACGAGVFVAVGTAWGDFFNSFLFSLDGGVTFQMAKYPYPYNSETFIKELNCVVSDARFLIAAGEECSLYDTQMVPSDTTVFYGVFPPT